MSNYESVYFSFDWQEKPLGKSDKKIKQSEILFFQQGEELSKELSEATIVKIGKTYKKIDKRHFEINPTKPEEYEKLFQEVEAKYLLYNWCYGIKLSTLLNRSVYSSLYLFKALYKKEARIIFLDMKGEETSHPAFSGLSGAGKTIEMESRRHKCSTLAISDTKEAWSIIQNELQEKKADAEIKYQNGKRWVRAIAEKVSPKTEAKLKNKGTYLITGGMGGLGYIFAEYLAKEASARLILTGRTKENDSIKEKLKKLEELGGKAIYISTDLAKEKETKVFLEKALKKFKKIDGVIHSAGVNADNFVLKKSKEDLNQVLPSKTHGLVNIHKELKKQKLDFFVLFSSGAGCFGNTGQFDYSYANAFMDAFAEQNEGVYSINWPLWREGGMQVDQETEKLMENMMGTVAMDTPTGIDAFWAALNGEYSNFGVMFGRAEKMRSRLGLEKKEEISSAAEKAGKAEKAEKTEKNKPAKQTKKTKALSEEDIKKDLSEKIGELVAKALDVDISEIDSEAEINSYGLDLHGATTITDFLDHQYTIQISPNLLLQDLSLNSLIELLQENHWQEITEHYGVTLVTETSSEKKENKPEKPSVSPPVEYKEMEEPKSEEGEKPPLSSELHKLMEETPEDDWDAAIEELSQDEVGQLIEELKIIVELENV